MTEGQEPLLAGVAIDVTEQHRLEQQIARAQLTEGPGRMAAGVAHNFNNALTIISSLAELGNRRTNADDELHEVFGDILGGSRRASELVRRLLAYASAPTAEPRRTNWNAVLEHPESMLHGLTAGTQVELRLERERQPRPIDVDATLMEQVRINLVQNAIQAIRDAALRGASTASTQGIVRVVTSKLAAGADSPCAPPLGTATACISVVDNGPGIPSADLARIFDPFFTTRAQGTGLGLASVQALVEHGGGRATASSQPGDGTRFDIYLPVAKE